MPNKPVLESEPRQSRYDAVVVGSGPNGLAAAITLARAKRSVLVVEAAERAGGGLRSLECTLPGFVHDHCATVHAFSAASPFLRTLPWAEHGLTWIRPEAPCAHPFEDGSAAVMESSLDATSTALGVDGGNYRKVHQPLLDQADWLLEHNLGPFRLPSRPITQTRFGLRAIRSALSFANAHFATREARGLFAGLAAHSVLPLERPLTSAIALMLTLAAHKHGWFFAAGGSQSVADAMVSILSGLGGEVVVQSRVERLSDLPESRAVLFDLAPRHVSQIAGSELPDGYRRKLERFRHGPGVFKLDWALDGPIPWRARDCARASTVHVGGTLEEVADAERTVWAGQPPDRPFLLVSQQTPFDPSRAPKGKHTGWAYCHVPPGCTTDMTAAIEQQMELFAPGFKDLILARHTTSPLEFERFNPNYVGGDIVGGVIDAGQLFTRPVARLNPYTTPSKRLFLCSASTPPGGGAHGMCGYHAAKAALDRILRD